MIYMVGRSTGGREEANMQASHVLRLASHAGVERPSAESPILASGAEVRQKLPPEAGLPG
jgi:hypothetical protein